MKRTVERRSVNIKKLTLYAIVVNALQILAMCTLAAGLIITKRVDTPQEGCLLGLCALIVIWGAAVDIRDAAEARGAADKSVMLEEALRQTEELNLTLRKQRHDFMNHLQVVFGLIELDRKDEAREYVERIYGDIRSVGHFMRTAHPALNALIAAKSGDCDERHIEFKTDITSDWANVPVPAWELCRVFGNLIDNAMDALADTSCPSVTFRLGEDIKGFTFAVEDNGPGFDDTADIFRAGFTTKVTGHGMGLAIVKDIVTKAGGSIEAASVPGHTVFSGAFPRG